MNMKSLMVDFDGSEEAEGRGEIPDRLPVLPLKDGVLFPHLVLPLAIEKPGPRKVIDDVMVGDHLFAVSAVRIPAVMDAGPSDIYDVGAVVRVLKLMKQPEGSYRIIVRVLRKVRLRNFEEGDHYFDAAIEPLPEEHASDAETEALVANLQTQFEKLVRFAKLPNELTVAALNVERPIRLAYIIASNLNLTIAEQQTILEIPHLNTALERTTFYLVRQLEKLELARQIQDRVKAGLDRRQREYYLREQLRVIKQELGEEQGAGSEAEELSTRLKEMQMPEEARRAAEKEIERLARMSPASSEYTVSRNYLDWLLEMPWSVSTEDCLHIRQAEAILNEDHFDLEKVKRRILEYLAVLQLKKDLKGPILCFAGPPGVGKTSLGQSIARSLERKFLRISLGGMRDEAEIRGHRRTYVGALPGRIIQGLRRVQSNNPVFMLDEIDKVGSDFRGDLSSALLEALDPEQNHSFFDHYLGVSFDLSRVLFLATANVLDTIPPALRDRLEIIEISGYTEEEKVQIARRHLVERQLENHGLSSEQITLPDETVLQVIRSYTREAGVRNLNRNIAALCRHAAKEIVDGNSRPIQITPAELPDVLGPVRFLPEMSTRSWGPGVSTGLAWTPTGGDLIFIEALKTPGHGKLILTGQLGEIMKESATAALTYIRAHAAELKIEVDEFDKSDIHVHVPAGAIPKDGPSAGVPLVVTLASLMSRRPVRREIAMTGEITLRGDILPVGGIKEKVLAARRAGLREVLFPQANAKDLVDIPEHLRNGMIFHELNLISEALAMALMPAQPVSS